MAILPIILPIQIIILDILDFIIVLCYNYIVNYNIKEKKG